MTRCDGRTWRALCVGMSVAALGACSGEGGGSAEQYCASVGAVRTATTAGALLARVREVGEVVPGDIEEDWQVLTDLFVLIAQADPNDADATAAAYEAALDPAVQKAAESVRAFTQITCGFSLDDSSSPLVPAPEVAPTTAAP